MISGGGIAGATLAHSLLRFGLHADRCGAGEGAAVERRFDVVAIDSEGRTRLVVSPRSSGSGESEQEIRKTNDLLTPDLL